ncbi:MAG: tetratricopeptide repeat protein [Verrucomicrobiota bacterium]
MTARSYALHGMVLLAAWLAVPESDAAQRTASKDDLRRLSRMPKMDLEMDLNFDPRGGFAVFSSPQDLLTEIAKAGEALKGAPSDAELHYRMGQLFLELKDSAKAAAAHLKAVELYRQAVDLQPGNGWLLAQLGQALQAAGKTQEAESKLREAVRIAAQEWKCWLALGQFCQGRSLSMLTRTGAGRGRASFDELTARLLNNPPSPDRLEQAQKWMDEASSSFDQAVLLGPEEAQPFLQRGLHRSFRSGLQAVMQALQGGEARIQTALFTPDALADFSQVLKLNPKDDRTIGAIVLFEAISFLLQSRKADVAALLESGCWEALPEKTRQSVRQGIARLENLAENGENRVAARSLEVLGLLQFVILKDLAGSEASLRRAVALDAGREQAWNGLTAVLIAGERYRDLLETCQERLNEKHSTRNRLFLAKAHEKLSQFDRAEQHVQAALLMNPDDFTANLALASLLMKRSDGSAVMLRAKDCLSKAERNLRQAPAAQGIIDLALAQGIYHALTDNPETARQILKGILELDKDNREVKEVLAALGN